MLKYADIDELVDVEALDYIYAKHYADNFRPSRDKPRSRYENFWKFMRLWAGAQSAQLTLFQVRDNWENLMIVLEVLDMSGVVIYWKDDPREKIKAMPQEFQDIVKLMQTANTISRNHK